MANKLLLVLFALCFVPSIVSAGYVGESLLVKGSVYCDTCLCGYETDASKYMAGATVRVECSNRKTGELTYTSPEATTDPTGQYTIKVESDQRNDYCDVMLVKSSKPECSTLSQGRERSRVSLTRNNGMTSNIRFANNMGFLANTPLANCAQILMKYTEAGV
ncbi:hypothetical protein OROGR_019051 [Orobanche gracilis]